jgi:putative membrane protein
MKQLDPKAEKYFFYKLVLSLTIPLLILIFAVFWPLIVLFISAISGSLSLSYSFTVSNSPFFAFFIILILYLLVLRLWARLTYKNYFYELTNKSFRKEKGVIAKKYVDIPYSRIQNIDIHRSLLARILGLSDIYIQTAGISGQIVAEGTLPALDPEEALRLRDELISRIDNKKDQGL